MIKIATCQYKIEKFSNWEAYTKKITALVKQAKDAAAQLLLLPEYAGIECGGYHVSDAELYLAIQEQLPKYCELFQNLAQQNQLYIQPGTLPVSNNAGKYFNRAYFFSPEGKIAYQDKLQLIEYEKHTQFFQLSETQTVFTTALGKIGIAVCYDCEFPEIVRRLVAAGAWLILVPSYTVSVAGYQRVSVSARARALENQCYVATSFIVGTVATTEPPENTVGQAAIYGPIESSFSDDGILAAGLINEAQIIYVDLSAEKISALRNQGEVRNYADTQRYNEISANAVINKEL